MADDEKGASESSSVRDDLLAAFKEHEAPDESETQSAPATGSERVRDAAGRFVPQNPVETEDKTEEKPSAAPRVPAATEPDRTANLGSHEASAPKAAEVAAAPPAWSNSVKAKWAALDPEVRSEILKREQDVHRQFTTNDQERQFGREIRQIVAPYEPLIRSIGSTPQAAITDVLNTAYILRTADPQTKAATIAKVIQDYGIDMKLLGNGQQPQVLPEVAALQQEVRQLRAERQQERQQQEQTVQQQVLQLYDAFAQDPKHPHFKSVQALMGTLMQAGQAKDMEEAYQMAVYARPDLRQSLLAETTAQQQQVTEQRQRTERARAKAVSVRGGPGGFTPATTNPNATLRETIEAAMAEHAGRI